MGSDAVTAVVRGKEPVNSVAVSLPPGRPQELGAGHHLVLGGRQGQAGAEGVAGGQEWRLQAHARTKIPAIRGGGLVMAG